MLSTELPDIVTFHLRVLVNKCHEQHEPSTCDAFFPFLKGIFFIIALGCRAKNVTLALSLESFAAFSA